MGKLSAQPEGPVARRGDPVPCPGESLQLPGKPQGRAAGSPTGEEGSRPRSSCQASVSTGPPRWKREQPERGEPGAHGAGSAGCLSYRPPRGPLEVRAARHGTVRWGDFRGPPPPQQPRRQPHEQGAPPQPPLHTQVLLPPWRPLSPRTPCPPCGPERLCLSAGTSRSLPQPQTLAAPPLLHPSDVLFPPRCSGDARGTLGAAG